MHHLAVLARRRSTLQAEPPPGGRPPVGPNAQVDQVKLKEAESKVAWLQKQLDDMGPKHVALAVGGFFLGALTVWAFSSSYQKNPAWKPGAFDRMVRELMAQGHSEDSARRIAASVGRKKYGQKEMTHRSQMGKAAKKKGR